MPETVSERLIIFTRYPQPGTTKTRMIPVLGPEGAADLQRRMTEHVVSEVRRLCAFRPLSVEVRFEGGNGAQMSHWLGPDFVYSPQQTGDIGRRMGMAMQDAFESGTDATVIIGTDIPDISTRILQNAFDKLRKFDLVFGPAKDGGYYLIGMKKETLPTADPQLFQGIAWGTSDVLSQTLATAKDLALRFTLLDTLEDVDRPADLPVWQRAEKSAANTSDAASKLSIIIPALNEARKIAEAISILQKEQNVEIIVVDGGSRDGTADLARSLGAKVIETAPSKAGQMNAGAAIATGDILVFLHADTRMPDQYKAPILGAMARDGVAAGAFKLRIQSDAKGLRFIEAVANWRSRHLQMPYGDQTLFVTKTLFDGIGGYPDLPIMEDFELIRRLRHRGKIIILPQTVQTSPRRWQNFGILKTWLLNQLIIVSYYLGISPRRLARWYRRDKGRSGK